MADIANKPSGGSTTSNFNSGLPMADIIRKQPKMLILHDNGFFITPGDRGSISSVVAALKTSTRAPRGGRSYPIVSISNFEDSSTEAVKAAIGNLSNQEITMQEGIPAFGFRHYKGELFQKQLAAAENANLRLFIVDTGNVLYGTETSNGNLTGFTMAEFKAQLAKFATASDPSQYPFNIVLDSITEYKDNLMFIQLDSSISNISGIVDVNLNTTDAPPAQTTNVIRVSPIGRGGKNLGSIPAYATALAATAAWVGKNAQTSATVTLTSVTWDGANGQFVITTDSTAYTALTPGQKFTVDLVTPAALLALGVDGFESLGPVTLTKA